MGELEPIAPILFRAHKGLEKLWEEQVGICDLEKKETDASQESQDSFDDM